MLEGASGIATAIGGAVAAVFGAYSLLVRAHGAAAKPVQVLQRLWDWVEDNGHDKPVPPTLRADVEAVIAEARDDD